MIFEEKHCKNYYLSYLMINQNQPTFSLYPVKFSGFCDNNKATGAHASTALTFPKSAPFRIGQQCDTKKRT